MSWVPGFYWLKKIVTLFKEFSQESSSQSALQVVDIHYCPDLNEHLAVFKIRGERHYYKQAVKEAILDDRLIRNLNVEEVRALTYLSAFDQFKPRHLVVSQKFNFDIEDYIFQIKTNNQNEIEEFSALELSENQKMIKKFSSLDAHRIGYFAGISKTVTEFDSKESNKSE